MLRGALHAWSGAAGPGGRPGTLSALARLPLPRVNLGPKTEQKIHFLLFLWHQALCYAAQRAGLGLRRVHTVRVNALTRARATGSIAPKFVATSTICCLADQKWGSLYASQCSTKVHF